MGQTMERMLQEAIKSNLATTDGMIRWFNDGDIVEFNEAWRRPLGYNPLEAEFVINGQDNWRIKATQLKRLFYVGEGKPLQSNVILLKNGVRLSCDSQAVAGIIRILTNGRFEVVEVGIGLARNWMNQRTYPFINEERTFFRYVKELITKGGEEGLSGLLVPRKMYLLKEL